MYSSNYNGNSILFNPFSYFYSISGRIPIFEMRKLRPRNGETCPRSYSRSEIWTLVSLIAQSVLCGFLQLYQSLTLSYHGHSLMWVPLQGLLVSSRCSCTSSTSGLCIWVVDFIYLLQRWWEWFINTAFALSLGGCTFNSFFPQSVL